MRSARLAALCVGWAAVASPAASFDCEKPRNKLERVICSDTTLSALDAQVWDAYGARIRGLSALQYAHARERHIAWRRARGLYDTGLDALIHEHRTHLAWLSHPLLPLEGRYARDGDAQGPRIEAGVDIGAADLLDLRGYSGARALLAWTVRAAAAGAPAHGSASVRIADGRARFTPDFAGTPSRRLGVCEFRVSFGDDRLTLEAIGECGADFAGTYLKVARQ